MIALKPDSRLQEILAAGEFAVTGELGPPKSADVEVIYLSVSSIMNSILLPVILSSQVLVCLKSSIAFLFVI